MVLDRDGRVESPLSSTADIPPLQEQVRHSVQSQSFPYFPLYLWLFLPLSLSLVVFLLSGIVMTIGSLFSTAAAEDSVCDGGAAVSVFTAVLWQKNENG